MKRTADVVIVGGGVTGASLAFHLSSQGVRDVVLLERTTLAAGGTGRSVGIIRQLYPAVEAIAMVKRSLAVFQNFSDVVGGSAGFVPCGVLIGVPSAMRPQLFAAVAAQQKLGLRVEVLEPSEAKRIEPRVDTSTLGAVLWESESGYGDPTAVAIGFAEAARRRGVTIEQGVEVTTVLTTGDRVSGVATARDERIATPVVVNATGLWAQGLARTAGIELPIVVGRHPVFVIERAASFGRSHAVYLDLAGGAYIRPETGNLTLTGSLTDDETRHPVHPEQLGAQVTLEEAEPVLARTSRAVPALAEARFRGGWVGAFDITPDWMPILDEAPVRGLWIAAGMSGHGFKLAPAVGEHLAARILGVAPLVDPRPFRLDRFVAAPAQRTFVSSYLR